MYDLRYFKNTNNGENMKKCFICVVTILFLIVAFNLTFIYKNQNFYLKKLNEKTNIFVKGPTAPRGRILDVSGKVIVDNKKLNAVFYKKDNSFKYDELLIVKSLAQFLRDDKVSETDLKKYFKISQKESYDALLSNEEINELNNKGLSKNKLDYIKMERITSDMLDKLNKKEALIYKKMNDGYNYQIKMILNDLTDQEIAQITEMALPGIIVDYVWERTYPYNDTMKSILGSVGRIPENELEEYLKKGYKIDDTVGVSYLEKEYDELLKGSNAIYKLEKNNKLKKVEEAKRGKDIVLSIDIDKQVYIENVLQEKIANAKKEANTKYYKESYAIVSNPTNGSIIAMAGKRLIKDDIWEDVAKNIINTSYTMGSVVKGATIGVGYKYNIIDMGTKMKDGCVKLYYVPKKCSFKNLGVINDLQALQNSSNYYQFKIAIGLTGKKYKPNMKLNATEEDFLKYRNFLASFGLGKITNIDLPNEENGIIGKVISDDLLLNLAIGQYDTYTPIQVVQYINTIAADGKKYSPSLLKGVMEDNKLSVKEKQVDGVVDLEEDYLKRIKTGLNLVLLKGTGRGHVDASINPAGKTGTSQSFYDSNNDNISDVETVTKAFAAFMPVDNPLYSVVVISPNVSYNNPSNSYTSNVNRKIARAITDFLFEK